MMIRPKNCSVFKEQLTLIYLIGAQKAKKTRLNHKTGGYIGTTEQKKKWPSEKATSLYFPITIFPSGISDTLPNRGYRSRRR